jgi:hypothetical protein
MPLPWIDSVFDDPEALYPHGLDSLDLAVAVWIAVQVSTKTASAEPS